MTIEIYASCAGVLISIIVGIHLAFYLPFLKAVNIRAEIKSTYSVASKVKSIGISFNYEGVLRSESVPVRDGDRELNIADRGEYIEVWLHPKRKGVYLLTKPNFETLLKNSLFLAVKLASFAYLPKLFGFIGS